MKHSEFNEHFKENVLPVIQKAFESDGIRDIPARCEAYNNEMDSFHKDGLITDKQVNNWVIPSKFTNYSKK